MKIEVKNGTLPQVEIDAYVAKIKRDNPGKYIKSYVFTVDGDYVDVDFEYDIIPFERIRRITGYLVGGLDRFNDAKRAEVEDRLKHNI